jgi:hypothetical protein
MQWKILPQVPAQWYRVLFEEGGGAARGKDPRFPIFSLRFEIDDKEEA